MRNTTAGIINFSFCKRNSFFILRYLREAVTLALSGKTLPGGGAVEKALISNFEILNLVPTSNKVEEHSVSTSSSIGGKDEVKKPPTITQTQQNTESTKWRRVGLVLGRKVHLDTIVW